MFFSIKKKNQKKKKFKKISKKKKKKKNRRRPPKRKRAGTLNMFIYHNKSYVSTYYCLVLQTKQSSKQNKKSPLCITPQYPAIPFSHARTTTACRLPLSFRSLSKYRADKSLALKFGVFAPRKRFGCFLSVIIQFQFVLIHFGSVF